MVEIVNTKSQVTNPAMLLLLLLLLLPLAGHAPTLVSVLGKP
jgi:hypothetical protein